MSRKAISKNIRELVFNKYNKHCAYCGCELEYKDMQIDQYLCDRARQYYMDERTEL